MKLLKHNFVVNTPRLYLAALIIGALSFSVTLYLTDEKADARLLGVYSGLASGLVIASLQFLTQYLEQKALSEYKEYGLLEFLANRKNTEYYRNLIDNTKVGDNIIVAGVTCNRLLDDFANLKAQQSQNLLEALARGVKVTLLLPKTSYLEEPNLSDFKNKTLPRSEEIKNKHSNFEILYYDFEPSHSIFLAGSRCLVGPIFKNKSSKDTPAISFEKDGLYIKPYLDYIQETLAGSSLNHD